MGKVFELLNVRLAWIMAQVLVSILSVSSTLIRDIPTGCVKLSSGGIFGERLGLRLQPEVSVRFHIMMAGIFKDG